MVKSKEIVNKEKVYEGFFPINILTIQDSEGKLIKREQVILHEAVAGIVYDSKKEEFIFVKQFRVGSEGNTIEIPAGKMDIEGESPENTLKREILEEIGYKVDSVEKIIDYYPSIGSSTEKTYLFSVEVSEQINKGGGLEDEDIEIVKVSKSKMLEMFYNGEFKDGKTIISILNILKK